jgi:hypothetical protein
VVQPGSVAIVLGVGLAAFMPDAWPATPKYLRRTRASHPPA